MSRVNKALSTQIILSHFLAAIDYDAKADAAPNDADGKSSKEKTGGSVFL
jgi:hypothetical protein